MRRTILTEPRAAGMRSVYYVAQVDERGIPGRRLSGRLEERAMALDVLSWLQHRFPRVALVHERLSLTVELLAA